MGFEKFHKEYEQWLQKKYTPEQLKERASRLELAQRVMGKELEWLNALSGNKGMPIGDIPTGLLAVARTDVLVEIIEEFLYENPDINGSDYVRWLILMSKSNKANPIFESLATSDYFISKLEDLLHRIETGWTPDRAELEEIFIATKVDCFLRLERALTERKLLIKRKIAPGKKKEIALLIDELIARRWFRKRSDKVSRIKIRRFFEARYSTSIAQQFKPINLKDPDKSPTEYRKNIIKMAEEDESN
ncbi:hypothetical protein A8C56_23570 [Niabella ginsenosidivorans]|uniref:Uncharacterized protein n=1 Tax=Niabella ginsenosidivorans TaxID=1176587 RepID=A0A1A9IAG8_9BACT|nr:hypothetical protein [Niabella ginsenosidivorans]ANH83554.1 hypothetical protein A8C56_23570 [Niabella ginsenosidivorans]